MAMRSAGSWLASGVLVLAATGCASTDWRQRYLEKERESADASGQLSDERNARAASVSQLEEAKTRIATLESENLALKDRAAAATAAAPAPAPSDANLEEAARQMQEKIGGGGKVSVTADGNIVISLPADITFSPGSKDLAVQGKKSVDAVAKELKERFAGYSIRVEGHTDTDPIRKSNFVDNFELGAERALSVVRYMVKSSGLEPERLIPASRGETQPLADNKTAAGKARNRRVEIVVLVPRDAATAQSK